MRRYRLAAVVIFTAVLGTAVLFGAGKGDAKAPSSAVELRPAGSPATTADLASLGLTIFPEPQTLPAVRASTLGGGTLSMEAFRGKYVFLNFWATWCPPCRAEMPSMEKLHLALKDERFAIFAISVGEKPETVTGFLKNNPYTFPIGLDPENRLGAVFAGRGIPTTYIIDPQGRAIAGMIGGREWDDPSTIELFRSLARGK